MDALTQLLQGSVKDLTVTQHILITAITTLFTYFLVFGVNWWMIREGRRKERLSRQAEAVKIVGLRRADVFDEVIVKLGEARALVSTTALKMLRLGSEAEKQELAMEVTANVFNLMDSAVALSGKVGLITQFEGVAAGKDWFDTAFMKHYEQLLEDSQEVITGEGPQRRYEVMLNLVNEMIKLVQRAAIIEGTASQVAFVAAGGKITRSDENLIRTMESPLHGKESWEPLSRWDHFRKNREKGIPTKDTTIA